MFDNINQGIFFGFLHIFLCTVFTTLHLLPPSDSTESEDAEIEPGTSALAVRRSNYSARSSPHRLDLIRLTIVAYLESLVEIDRHLGGVAAEEDDHNGGEYPGHSCVAPYSRDKTRLS
jgi:hypothetical protein